MNRSGFLETAFLSYESPSSMNRNSTLRGSAVTVYFIVHFLAVSSFTIVTAVESKVALTAQFCRRKQRTEASLKEEQAK